MDPIGRLACSVPEFLAANAMMNIVGPDQYKHLANRFHKISKTDPTAPDISIMAGIAILHYTNKGFEPLNMALRGGPPIDRDLLIQSTIMCEALEDFPRFEGQVFRSERSWAGMWDLYRPGNRISIPNFFSTSSDPSCIFDTGITLVIDQRLGRILNPYSLKPNEREVLFVPGTTFYVRAIDNLDRKPIIYLGEE